MTLAALDENKKPTSTRSLAHLTVRSASLARWQRVHSAFLLMAPLVGVLALVPFTIKWGVTLADLALFIGLYAISVGGVSVGFHRLFAHRAFEATLGLKIALGIAGSLAAQGPLTYWVANHRRHHLDSDGPDDPHSPNFGNGKKLSPVSGFWHAQVGWTGTHALSNTLVLSSDLLADPTARFIGRTYFMWVGLGLLIPTLIGGLIGWSPVAAMAGFLWGGLARLFVGYHATSLINSACHLVGGRRFETADQSRNLNWLALFTFGEGLHNNHHARPRAARFARQWWEPDAGATLIRLFAALRWARDPVGLFAPRPAGKG